MYGVDWKGYFNVPSWEPDVSIPLLKTNCGHASYPVACNNDILIVANLHEKWHKIHNSKTVINILYYSCKVLLHLSCFKSIGMLPSMSVTWWISNSAIRSYQVVTKNHRSNILAFTDKVSPQCMDNHYPHIVMNMLYYFKA